MKQTKKGFTLVELLVVIAILAILTTVSVVGYTSFIEKANRSVDEQAVAQMNIALIAGNIPDGQFKSILDVIAFLDSCDLDVEDYKPLAKDKYFFWDSVNNRIIYTDNNYNVLAPAGIETNEEDWISLTGKIEGLNKEEEEAFVAEVRTAIGANTAIEVGSKEELYALSNNFDSLVNNSANIGKTITIKLVNSINCMGASIVFSFNNVDKTTTLVITADSEVILSNIAQTDVSKTAMGDDGNVGQYYGALFKETRGKVEFKNITLKNCSFGDENTGSVAGFVSKPYEDVTYENCKVVDSHLVGKNKVAPFVAQGQSAKITFTNCVSSGNIIFAQEGAACQIVGLWEVGAVTSGVTVSNNTLQFGAGPLTGDAVKYNQSRQNGVLYTYGNTTYTPVVQGN